MIRNIAGNMLKLLNSMPRFIPAAVLAAFWLAACSPKIDKTGYVFNEETLSEITPGISDKEAVLTALGSPSTKSSFGPESWYYIHNHKEAYAFFDYEITAQDVVSVSFDESGIVEQVSKYNLDDSQDIAIVKRETPSEGHSLGFFEQVLGNIGRFNSPAGSSTPSNNRSGPPVGR